MSPRATASKRGLESSCDGFANPFPTPGDPRATDVVGSCFFEDLLRIDECSQQHISCERPSV
jgi:hypothetical protein